MEQPLIDFNSYPLRIALKRLLKDKATKKFYTGDIDTATFITEEGTELVKAWALPLGTYTIDHKYYSKIKVYKFAGGEGMQEAAFEKYGEGYGF